MKTDAIGIQTPTADRPMVVAAGKAAGEFEKKLRDAADAVGGAGNSIDNSEARKRAEAAAAGLVSNALILPVLQQLRRSAWGGDGVFSGGKGEKAFGPQFDMQLADHIAQSPRLGIKNALADRLMKRSPTNRTAAMNKGIDVHG